MEPSKFRRHTICRWLSFVGCAFLVSCGENNIFEVSLSIGKYKLDGQFITQGKMSINLSECLTYSDQMQGKDPNTLTLSTPISDSIYAGSECMAVSKQGNCFIVDQGILGSGNCNPGTFTKRH
jgi:hypothetical protein